MAQHFKRFAMVFIFLLFFFMLLNILFSFFSSSVSAVTLHTSQDEKLTDVFVIMSNGSIEKTAYIPEEGELAVPFSFSEITFFIDDLATPGKDYFARTLFTSSTQEIIVFPVGSIQGIILDDHQNLIPNASIVFSCEGTSGDAPPSFTDSFGGFSYMYAPPGACQINASYKDLQGSANITFQHGKQKEIAIILQQTSPEFQISKIGKNFIFGFLIIFVFLVLLLFLKKPKHKNLKLKKSDKSLIESAISDKSDNSSIPKQASGGFTRQQQALISQLNLTEKEIILFLQQEGGGATQAHIYHKTTIPKSSLSRTLQELSDKDLIIILPHGKEKKVILSDKLSKK